MKPRITWPLVADSGGGGGSYVLPVATSGTLGGVKVETATAEQTQPVGIGADAKLYTEPIPTLVQSDWDETDTTDPAYIANKPTIPEAYTLPIATSSTLGGVTAAVKDTETAEVVVDPYGKLYYEHIQADWTQADDTDPAYIANKPTIPDVSGKRDLPAAVSVHVIDPNTAIGNVAANTVYTCDAALTYLSITAVEVSNLESQVWFVAGATAPTIVLPNNVPVIGSTTFKASKGYVISFQNGVAVIGEYSVS